MTGKIESFKLGDKFSFAGNDGVKRDWVACTLKVNGEEYVWNKLVDAKSYEVGEEISFVIADSKTKDGRTKISRVAEANTAAGNGQGKPATSGNYWNSEEKINIDKARLDFELGEKQLGIFRSVALDKALVYFEVSKLKPTGAEGVLEIAEQFTNFLKNGYAGTPQSEG